MELLLRRVEFTPQSTIGKLSVDGEFDCFTLEHAEPADGVSICGETAIPAGLYDVDLTYSPRFRRPVPLVRQVEGTLGMRIGAGNTSQETPGCILVGRHRGRDRVMSSWAAFAMLVARLHAAKVAGQQIRMTIENQPAATN